MNYVVQATKQPASPNPPPPVPGRDTGQGVLGLRLVPGRPDPTDLSERGSSAFDYQPPTRLQLHPMCVMCCDGRIHPENYQMA